MKLLHWGLILRYVVYGVVPLIGLLILLEHYIRPGLIGAAFAYLALLLPFIAIAWLAYQHWRHR